MNKPSHCFHELYPQKKFVSVIKTFFSISCSNREKQKLNIWIHSCKSDEMYFPSHFFPSYSGVHMSITNFLSSRKLICSLILQNHLRASGLHDATPSFPLARRTAPFKRKPPLRDWLMCFWCWCICLWFEIEFFFLRLQNVRDKSRDILNRVLKSEAKKAFV